MSDKLRLVVVGLGSIGKRHLRLLLQRPDIQVEVCELNQHFLENVLKEFSDLPSHTDYTAMLSTGPDVVWLATPTALHARQSTAALNSGAHVFCEKPMTDSVADAEQVCLAAENSDRIFNVGFHLHFHPAIRRLKELIQTGVLGNLLHLHARVGTYYTLECSISRHQADKEGALVWDYAHQPDMFCWLTGVLPQSVHATGFQGGRLELSSNPNVLSVTCRYAEPMIATIHLNYVQAPERHEYEIVGDKGWCILNMNEGILRTGLANDKTVQTETFIVDRDAIYRSEHDAFFEATAGKRLPETPAHDGMQSVSLCEAVIRSWQKDCNIQL